MLRKFFLTLGVLLAPALFLGSGASFSPAAASDGPFPALMNSLFGSGHASPGHVPRNHYRQAAPLPGHHGQAYRSPLPHPHANHRYHAQPQHRGHARQAAAPAARAVRNPRAFDPKFRPQVVRYSTKHRPGTIVVDSRNKFLYLVMKDGKAKRYGVGVGRPGFQWYGSHKITRKAKWPSWTPPAAMRKRQPWLPVHMKGGPENPMGARALYLGSTLYRIHGSNEPWSIGMEISSGCIRMRNEDVIDLYQRVKVGAKVVVI
jgi:lipoprotein-anchoring transpeptidase ErfK/SrfK